MTAEERVKWKENVRGSKRLVAEAWGVRKRKNTKDGKVKDEVM